jgi:hypothetical protein
MGTWVQTTCKKVLSRRLIVSASLLPFLVVPGLIAQARIDFYPITQSIGLYDYEIVLLLLLLAPFVYALPSISHRGLTAMRKVYWAVFFSVVVLIVAGILIMFATKQI